MRGLPVAGRCRAVAPMAGGVEVERGPLERLRAPAPVPRAPRRRRARPGAAAAARAKPRLGRWAAVLARTPDTCRPSTRLGATSSTSPGRLPDHRLEGVLEALARTGLSSPGQNRGTVHTATRLFTRLEAGVVYPARGHPDFRACSEHLPIERTWQRMGSGIYQYRFAFEQRGVKSTGYCFAGPIEGIRQIPAVRRPCSPCPDSGPHTRPISSRHHELRPVEQNCNVAGRIYEGRQSRQCSYRTRQQPE